MSTPNHSHALIDEPTRCSWCLSHPLMTEYHDREWGVLRTDNAGQFEHIMLETFQAGLSWLTILKKRENFRHAFDRFDPDKIAGYSDQDINRLMQDTGIIRSQSKIAAAINNSRIFLEITEEFGDFYSFLIQYKPKRRKVYRTEKDIPSQTPESRLFSIELRRRGFKYIGPVICYAHMQSVGIVNDHLISCFRYSELQD